MPLEAHLELAIRCWGLNEKHDKTNLFLSVAQINYFWFHLLLLAGS